MPVLLDDIAASQTTAATKYTPKFFSSVLTGTGGARGLLHSGVRPGRYPAGKSSYSNTELLPTKSRTSGSGVTTHKIPTSVLSADSVRKNTSRGITAAVPELSQTFHVNEGRANNQLEVHFDLTPQGVKVVEDANGEKTTRETDILYRMEVYALEAGSTTERTAVLNQPPVGQTKPEYAMVSYSYAPLDDGPGFIRQVTAPISPQGQGIHVDEDGLAEWMENYDVAERITALAEIWAEDGVAEIICRHIEEIFADGTILDDSPRLYAFANQLRQLEAYPVSLDAYRTIHQAMVDNCSEDLVLTFSKQNLNLLMSHTLEQLNAMKPQLATPPQNPSQHHVSSLPTQLSAQQMAAVTTDEPLVLTQAGAGTGKSTVILNRIKHLSDCGVVPADITVLSFTNAAADNIRAKNPSVGSMTIARMIHDIYTMNHPGHGMSSIDTIINSLDIFYPVSEFAAEFRRHLVEVDKNTSGATTLLNVFVEKYHEEVIEALDTIAQTCLELEIIICYQKIDEMSEPAEVLSRYLIIDEVQDNSVFEFIFVLKYVAKHQENLFIVGDASQTLYEFRAANPRALNTLEDSGVFATYQLTTNYRSNQEILDFANVHLADIKANESAGLRLQANSLDMPTADSFRKKVSLHHEWVPKFADFTENFEAIMDAAAKDYVRDCLERGEQVAFLAFSRRSVMDTETWLNQNFPQHLVANLTSERTYSTTVFSQYIKLFWNDVKQVDPKDASFTVTQGIINALDQLTNDADKAEKSVRGMVVDWWTENASAIRGWVQLYDNGQLDHEGFYSNLRQNLLDYEIQKNALKLRLNNERNRERKERNLNADAQLVVSTIHGAKGLEFDNVVVLHKYKSGMAEDEKRLYYVAFTRAMNSELVLSYSTQKAPRICSDYDLIIEQLRRRDKLSLLRDQGLNPDDMHEDDLAKALEDLDDYDGQSQQQQ